MTNKILIVLVVLFLVMLNLHYQMRLSQLERVFLATIEECGEAWLSSPVAWRHKRMVEEAG